MAHDVQLPSDHDDTALISVTVPIDYSAALGYNDMATLAAELNETLTGLALSRLGDPQPAGVWLRAARNAHRLSEHAAAVRDNAVARHTEARGKVAEVAEALGLAQSTAGDLRTRARNETGEVRGWVTTHPDTPDWEPGTPQWRAYWSERLRRALDTGNDAAVAQVRRVCDTAGVRVSVLMNPPESLVYAEDALMATAIKSMVDMQAKSLPDEEQRAYLRLQGRETLARAVIRLHTGLHTKWAELLGSDTERTEVKHARQLADRILTH